MEDIQNDIMTTNQDRFDTMRTSVQPLKKESKMADWLIKVGLAKDRMMADAILIVVASVIFGTSIYFYVFGFSKPVFLGPQLPVAEQPMF